ncbi:hypothetical protein [Methylotenera sp.]|uniref:hypothetical protein n=1 Tax=Methylotenera sp. TaxID=2051956 RepID=UPI002489AFCF|nr:hypothetical protein [Methylotenera sp.]MDI1299555.1 hypothetical protein [Methylotenera sp.]
MRIKFLTFCLTLFLVLSLPAVAEANQTQAADMAYLPNDIFSGAKTFIPFADYYANPITLDGGLNINNALTLFGYTKPRSLDASNLSDFFQSDDSQGTPSTKLGYGRTHEAFLSAISRVSSNGNDNFVNYAVSSVSRNIEVGSEPETYSMMFAGLILMGFVARRRTN